MAPKPNRDKAQPNTFHADFNGEMKTDGGWIEVAFRGLLTLVLDEKAPVDIGAVEPDKPTVPPNPTGKLGEPKKQRTGKP